MADVLSYNAPIPPAQEVALNALVTAARSPCGALLTRKVLQEMVIEESESVSSDAVLEGHPVNLQIRTHADPQNDGEAGALVVHSGGDLTPKGADQPQDQLTELLQELGMIEAQQEKLRDAVKHNKGIVVHPRHEVLEESESDYGDTPKAPSPKKKLVVSGGLTGFGIAQDLLQIDFSPPEEAPEEFKAVAFYEEPKQIKPGLSEHRNYAGSFGLCDPASKEMHHYLERLEEQQRLVLELITGKKQALLEHMQSKDNMRLTKQGGRARGAKSRLGRTGRLEETSTKTAVADALGLSAHEKELSLGTKVNSLALASKGSLANKLPIVAASNLPRTDEKPVRREVKVRATPAQVRRAVPVPARKAEVQKGDTEAKEQEEMKSLFATPIPGTTPSTMHLGGKAAAKASHAAAVAAAEAPSEANPYYAPTPQKQQKSPSKVPSTPGGRVSNLGHTDDEVPQIAAEQKSRLFGGLKKLMRSKSKA